VWGSEYYFRKFRIIESRAIIYKKNKYLLYNKKQYFQANASLKKDAKIRKTILVTTKHNYNGLNVIYNNIANFNRVTS